MKRLGGTSDIFTYSVRFSHAVWHRFKVSDQQNDGEGLKGGGTFPISWYISLVCMDFSQGKKVVSVEGYFMGTPEFDWFHIW